MAKIIIVVGRQGSGKGLLIDKLIAEHNIQDVQQVGFKRLLKLKSFKTAWVDGIIYPEQIDFIVRNFVNKDYTIIIEAQFPVSEIPAFENTRGHEIEVIDCNQTT